MEFKRKHLPKGFLSRNGKPTTHAVNMYVIYLTCLPKGWDINKLNTEAIERVRGFFKVDYGFGTMIQWGIQHSCCMSRTSSGRHSSMSKAFVLAQSLIGSGVVVPNVELSR